MYQKVSVHRMAVRKVGSLTAAGRGRDDGDDPRMEASKHAQALPRPGRCHHGTRLQTIQERLRQERTW